MMWETVKLLVCITDYKGTVSTVGTIWIRGNKQQNFGVVPKNLVMSHDLPEESLKITLSGHDLPTFH